ncbi:DUF3221 domain-containing protein [Alkalihalobacillus sp. AL-G]|uniref:DUF3221 domain-containing protein n=1 Tax=Alkalihalobacillus sp. AL-G TaxID=2926399 RepID=UPI00272B99FE|nr:DUF3221 domain-containing protein [Alkalihalobacillus sp. AL-G]WLD92846.1 DUF3221 domain-containing protein [Alkalihalobacillus sp. AL-G]
MLDKIETTASSYDGKKKIKFRLMVNGQLSEEEATELFKEVIVNVEKFSAHSGVWDYFNGYFDIKSYDSGVLYEATKLIDKDLVVEQKDTMPTDDGSSLEGYILDIKEGRVLVAYDITKEKFNQNNDKTIEDLSRSEEYIPLIYLSYDDTSSLNKGNKVVIWIEGGIEDSYPQQAEAKKIQVEN